MRCNTPGNLTSLKLSIPLEARKSKIVKIETAKSSLTFGLKLPNKAYPTRIVILKRTNSSKI